MVRLSESLDVQLHRISGYRPQWRVDQSLTLDVTDSLSPTLGLIVLGEAGEFRDQFTSRYSDIPPAMTTLPSSTDLLIGSSSEIPYAPTGEQISSMRLGAGGYYKGNDGISISTSIGPLSDNRGSRKRDGLRYDLQIAQNSDSLRWSANGWLAQLPGGADHDLRGDLAGSYQFSPESSDRFSFAYLNGNRAEISPVDGVLSKRQDERLTLGNLLSVAPADRIQINWESELNRLASRRNYAASDRRDSEFNWKNNANLEFSPAGVTAILHGGVDVQQQQYAGSLTQGLRNHLGFSIVRHWNSSDSLSFDLGSVKYRYDTPDENDHNDRDELRFTAEVAGGWALNRSLGLRAGLSSDLNHLVYVSRTRSGENRWARQFGLFVALPWNDSPVRNLAQFTLSSNFTDYDFSPFDVSQSRVFRSVTALDTLRLDLGGGWGMEINLAGQLDDYGNLLWDKWIENVSEEGYSYTIAGLPGYGTQNFQAAAGWMIHRRGTTVHNAVGGDILGQSVSSDGPIARMTATPSPGTSLDFIATSLFVRDGQRGNYNLPDLSLTFRWML
jgi:hypothetical protein